MKTYKQTIDIGIKLGKVVYQLQSLSNQRVVKDTYETYPILHGDKMVEVTRIDDMSEETQKLGEGVMDETLEDVN